jgi:hypothetical protein
MSGVVTDPEKYEAWIHKEYRNAVVSTARLLYGHRYGNIDPKQGCLYWAAAFAETAIERYDMKCLILAGSAQFQFRTDTDGVSNTHFSYMFSHEEAQARLDQGLSPEMHVWNYLPDTDDTVDLTTAYQVEQARRMCGFKWEKQLALPDYFWGKPDGQRYVYRADIAATVFALQWLKERNRKHEPSGME